MSEASSNAPTPFVSAPSSPRNSTDSTTHNAIPAPFSIPASAAPSDFDFSICGGFEPRSPFLYTGTLKPACSMSTADELFHNGQIKPLYTKFSSCTLCCNHASCYCDLGHTYTPSCPQCAACKGGSLLSRNTEDYSVPQTPRMQGQLVKVTPWTEISALEQWKKEVDQKNDNWPNASHAHAYQHVERVTQIPSVPLASYGNSGGRHHHKRAASLSPSRVFHMDDMIQPRPSFESELYTDMSSRVICSDVGFIKPRRRSTRKSWTLKELLNLGDNKVHDKRPHLGSGGSSHDTVKPGRKANADIMDKRPDLENGGDKKSSRQDSFHDKRSTYRVPAEGGMVLCSPWKLQRANDDALKHANHYHVGKEMRTEDRLKKDAPLAYKKALLGCLGFTSKLGSVRGLHAMHCNGG